MVLRRACTTLAFPSPTHAGFTRQGVALVPPSHGAHAHAGRGLHDVPVQWRRVRACVLESVRVCVCALFERVRCKLECGVRVSQYANVGGGVHSLLCWHPNTAQTQPPHSASEAGALRTLTSACAQAGPARCPCPRQSSAQSGHPAGRPLTPACHGTWTKGCGRPKRQASAQSSHQTGAAIRPGPLGRFNLDSHFNCSPPGSPPPNLLSLPP